MGVNCKICPHAAGEPALLWGESANFNCRRDVLLVPNPSANLVSPKRREYFDEY